MTPNPKRSNRFALIGFAFVWTIGIAIGGYAMLKHEFEPGAMDPAPKSIPDALASCFVDRKGVNIVVSTHPQCPCTRATLEQLETFLTKASEKAQVVVLFTSDSVEEESSPETSDYWRRVTKMPNARPLRDDDGTLSRTLGAYVSGTVVAYDRTGRLRFQGGLTASRGHSGSSIGLSALVRLLEDNALCESPSITAPVFGCELTSNDSI